MTENEKTIHKFYSAFAKANYKEMVTCYHHDIQFRDPVFKSLSGKEVSNMWQMLLERSKGNIKIEFSNIQADDYTGSAQWIATYNFSKTNRKVVNVIHASFNFKDGLIIKHQDNFDLWEWSKQAFGIPGYLLGWTGYMQQKIQTTAEQSLKKFEQTI